MEKTIHLRCMYAFSLAMFQRLSSMIEKSDYIDLFCGVQATESIFTYNVSGAICLYLGKKVIVASVYAYAATVEAKHS